MNRTIAIALTKVSFHQNFYTIQILMANVLGLDTCKHYKERQSSLQSKVKMLLDEKYHCIFNDIFHVQVRAPRWTCARNDARAGAARAPRRFVPRRPLSLTILLFSHLEGPCGEEGAPNLPRMSAPFPRPTEGVEKYHTEGHVLAHCPSPSLLAARCWLACSTESPCSPGDSWCRGGVCPAPPCLFASVTGGVDPGRAVRVTGRGRGLLQRAAPLAVFPPLTLPSLCPQFPISREVSKMSTSNKQKKLEALFMKILEKVRASVRGSSGVGGCGQEAWAARPPAPGPTGREL